MITNLINKKGGGNEKKKIYKVSNKKLQNCLISKKEGTGSNEKRSAKIVIKNYKII